MYWTYFKTYDLEVVSASPGDGRIRAMTWGRGDFDCRSASLVLTVLRNGSESVAFYNFPNADNWYGSWSSNSTFDTQARSWKVNDFAVTTGDRLVLRFEAIGPGDCRFTDQYNGSGYSFAPEFFSTAELAGPNQHTNAGFVTVTTGETRVTFASSTSFSSASSYVCVASVVGSGIVYGGQTYGNPTAWVGVSYLSGREITLNTDASRLGGRTLSYICVGN